MTIRVVVHVVVAVQYDTNDESLTMADMAKEHVPRAISHICSLIGEGQKQGVAPGVKFGVDRNEATVTAVILNPATEMPGVPR